MKPFTLFSGQLERVFFAAVIGLLSIHPTQAQITVLASFNGTNGNSTQSGLTLSSNGTTLYGTTLYGGANNLGSVFSVPTGGGAITTLASFNGTTGSYPYDDLVLIGNTLYGTTYRGGTNNLGTAFSLPVSGGTPTTLATFNGTNGGTPYGGLTLNSNGTTFYGVTGAGGAGGVGTVFSVPVTGGAPSTLASFNGTNGSTPYARLTLSGSTLLGTTVNGGANSKGTVFSVPLSGGALITLVSFNSTNGAALYAGLTPSKDGKTMFGATSVGGASSLGTIFSVPTSGGALTTLATFNNSTGNTPDGSLVLSSDGTTLYGTTVNGGLSNDGTIFSLPVSGGVPTTLASFNHTTSGSNPIGGLKLSADGKTLFGTTSGGGANGNGTVFAFQLPSSTISADTPTLPLWGIIFLAAFLALTAHLQFGPAKPKLD